MLRVGICSHRVVADEKSRPNAHTPVSNYVGFSCSSLIFILTGTKAELTEAAVETGHADMVSKLLAFYEVSLPTGLAVSSSCWVFVVD